jgi:hypothetical protein
MGNNQTPERKDDIANDDRRQFIARFGKLALVAAPTVAVLVTSMNSRAIACSNLMCTPPLVPDQVTCDHCICPHGGSPPNCK